MVKLYLTDIASLPDPWEQPEVIASLPKERRQKIERLTQEKKRKQSLGAGLLLEEVLTSYGIDVTTLRIGEHGKPEVDGLHFNLSHSDNRVACAVSDSPVGCDVEKVRKAPMDVAKRYFSQSEKTYLEQFDGIKYDEAFFRLWTMKESYAKMTGEGIGKSLKAFEVLMDEPVRVLRDGNIQACCIKEYQVEDYCISVCSEDTGFSDIIWKNI